MSSPIEADAATAPRPFSFSGTSSASYLDDQPQPQLQRPQQQQQLNQPQQRPHTSRFVEGSMNDRASRAPPVSYLGGIGGGNGDDNRGSRTRSRSRGRGNGADGARDDPYAHREYQNSTRRSLQMARPSLSAFRTSNTAASAGTSSSITSTNTTDTNATNATATSNNSSLRRPRSFLGPIWDGMTKRLHRRTRSTVEADMAKKREQEQQQHRSQQQHQQHHMQAMGPTPAAAALPGAVPGGDRLSPDEVLANYQQLMQSGFFSKRAIPATRQGLTSRGGTSSGTGSSSSSSTDAPTTCPTRPPPPPPKSAPWINGTPLSPVAPSPAGGATITITPRGTKRVRAPADEGEDVDARHDGPTPEASRAPVHSTANSNPATPTRNSPRKISKKLRKAPSIRSTLGQDGSVRSLRSMHNAAAAAAAAAEAEYTEAINTRPSTGYSAHGSVTSSTRTTRSQTAAHAPVQVHQPLPPLPVNVTVSAAPVSPAIGNEKRVVSKKRNGTLRISAEENRDSHQAALKVAQRRPEVPQEPKRKRRSQNSSAVVHQDRQGSNTGDVMILDDERSQEEKTRKQDTLRMVPTTNYHRPLGPSNPATPNRGGSRSNSGDNGRAVLTTLSPSSSQQKQQHSQSERPQPPISFHYPQRVRVRRPMQAQAVEITAGPLSASGNTRSKAQINGKNLLFREEDTENQVPIWQD
ncbi:hypothetical protein Sste5346_005779 [Sporothrix stenoceras]|uniref:Uncharacterized protein n=1 Tax=Sporothrix stenoceras TaxID=5173 RepID=A0ABR3Z4X6_9PEZI